MKKTMLLSLIILSLFSTAAAAAALDSFQFVLGGGQSITAGTTMAVTISAIDTGSNLKTDYTGPIALTAGVGMIIVAQPGNTFTTAADYGNTLTQAFSGGRWTGFITLTGAAMPVTITCVDYTGGYAGNGQAFQNVTPGPLANLLVLTNGMIWAPGTPSDPYMNPGDGYTGWPVTPTTYVAFNVTVMAVDAWSNTIVSGFPKVAFSSTATYAVTPTSVDMSNNANSVTTFAMTLYPSPDNPGPQNIIAKTTPATTYTTILSLYFASLTSYYLSSSAPISVTAGYPFSVTVYVSHFPPGGTVVPIATFNDNVQITGIDAVLGSALSPGLLPSSIINGSTTAGVALFTGISYTTASTGGSNGIRIQPKYMGVTYTMTNPNDQDRDSNIITIYADKPDHFTMSESADKVTLTVQDLISVNVYDQYGNPVSNTAVDFDINSGTGTFTESGANTQDAVVTTNSNGLASVHYYSNYNTKVFISASVAGLTGVYHYEIVEAGSVIDPSTIKNFPNPFNPIKGPTTIEYYLAADAGVKMTLYSFSGQLVWSKNFNAGSYPGGAQGYNAVPWNGTANSGMTTGAGLYTLNVEVSGPAGNYTLTRKIAVKK